MKSEDNSPSNNFQIKNQNDNLLSNNSQTKNISKISSNDLEKHNIIENQEGDAQNDFINFDICFFLTKDLCKNIEEDEDNSDKKDNDNIINNNILNLNKNNNVNYLNKINNFESTKKKYFSSFSKYFLKFYCR